MRIRIVTGLLAATAVSAIIFFGPYLAMMGVVVSAVILAYAELDRLLFEKMSPIRRLRMWVIIALACLAYGFGDILGWVYIWGAFLFLGVWHVISSYVTLDLEWELKSFVLEVFSLLYLTALFGFLVPIANIDRIYLFHLFFFVFMGDTAAYFVGSRFGDHELSPHLSPRKSIEGAIASVFGSCLGTVIWFFCIARSQGGWATLVSFLLFSVGGSVLAQMGDLFESLIKRTRSVKDSGAFLPGHGGMLDRIDSFAFVAPAYYFFLKFLWVKS